MASEPKSQGNWVEFDIARVQRVKRGDNTADLLRLHRRLGWSTALVSFYNLISFQTRLLHLCMPRSAAFCKQMRSKVLASEFCQRS